MWVSSNEHQSAIMFSITYLFLILTQLKSEKPVEKEHRRRVRKQEIKGERKGKFIPPPTTTRSYLKYGECVNLKVRISITLEVIFELLFL